MGTHAKVVRTGAAAPAERAIVEGEQLTVNQLTGAILMLEGVRGLMHAAEAHLKDLALSQTAERLRAMAQVVDIDISYLVAISDARRART